MMNNKEEEKSLLKKNGDFKQRFFEQSVIFSEWRESSRCRNWKEIIFTLNQHSDRPFKHLSLLGRKMIKEEKKVTEVLEEVIEELVEKLRQLQRKSMVDRDFEVRKCSNFDKEATLLRRKLEKLKLGPSSSSDDNHANEIRNFAESSLSINTKFFSDVRNFSDNGWYWENVVQVEILRKKMEGSSMGMLERVEEECGSISSSASTSRRTESADSSSSSTSTRQPYQASLQLLLCPKISNRLGNPSWEAVKSQQEMSREQKVCSGHCKVVVRRIVEQVRAEKEQWSQMQAMLGQVRQEMEELQASRDFWETRALDSDFQVQSLHWNAQEWRQKSLSLETKTNELQNKISSLEQELERLRKANAHSSVLGDQHEKEKRVVICRLKENHRINGASARQKEKFGDGRRNSFAGNNGGVAALKRSPFQDVGNLSPLLRQKSKLLFPL
ncbi:hypothetical protein RJ641_034182 [Dillenia turbinata]|uniref:Uncharacterized protein n=1 Tax=Dillenia turbinata TaxID=194707 RepID=A0AAN8W165_9MAGN